MKSKNFNKINLASQSTEKLRIDDLKQRMLTLDKVVNAKLKTINGLVFRNKGRGLIGCILKITRGVRPRSSKSVVKQVAWFSFKCYHLAKHSGLKGLVIYLKASQVLLQQSVARFRVVDLTELKVRPSRNRAGVPLIIPAGVRVLISRDRDIRSIKLWMTLLGFYRILDFKGVLNLSSITDKGPEISEFLKEWKEFLEKSFKPQLSRLIRLPEMSGPKLFPILKSGPTTLTLDDPPGTSYTNSSVRALVIAARIWLRKSSDNVMLSALTKFCTQIKDSKTFISRLQTIAMVSNQRIDDLDYRHVSLGAVRYKPEPAGKIRIFAMVDAWSQWLLHPLHDWLFKILRAIPQDGTFDQMSPILRLQSKYAQNPKGLWSSIDLSSATDRLPISMQVILLEVLLKDIVPDSKVFSESWRDILVERQYSTGIDPSNINLPRKFTVPSDTPSHVKYAVGQPMGALSSWAMLALTHHAMMQFSAHKCGSKDWYEDYAVLGDDGVIKGTNQTNAYRSLLQVIGVKAGLAKSILSKNKFVIEFAKKFFVDSTTANMLPFKESLATMCSTSLVVEFVRKYDLSLNAILSFLGYGYKSKMRVYKTLFFKLPSRLRVLLVWLSHPSSPLGKSSYTEWLLQKSWSESFTPSDRAVEEMTDIVSRLNSEKFDQIYTVFMKYIKTLEDTPKNLDSVTPIPIISMASLNGSDGATVTTNVPWNAVLSPELHSSDIDYDYLSAWNEGGMSNHGYRFSKLKDLKIGIDPWKLHDEFLVKAGRETDSTPIIFFGKEITPRGLINPLDTLSDKLQLLFGLDDLKAAVPEKFWTETREGERPFRDFLSIYKLWQEITKPLWSEFYGKDLSLPIKTQYIKQERGDIEGQIHPESPSGSYLNFPWVDFLVVSIGTFIVLEWLHGNSNEPLVLPFLYDIKSTESALPLELLEDKGRSNILAIALITAGALLLSGSIFLSYYQGHPWAWIGILESEVSSNPSITIQTSGLQEIGDTVMAGSVMVSGPLSASSLSLVQIRLENQALLDNLAISPIGDLWITPW